MASWAFAATVSELFGVRQPAYLDGKIYFIDSIYNAGATLNPGGRIIEIDPAGPTQTTILTPTSFTDHYSTWSIASFGGDLYAAIELFIDPDVIIRVYRWDGTPEDWTQVLSLNNSDSSMDRYVRLYADAGNIVLYGRDYVDDSGFVKYSADGASWNAGTISGVDSANGDIEFDGIVYWPLGIYERVCVNNSGGASCTDTDVYSFTGGGMAVFQASPAGLLHQSAPATRHTVDQGYYGSPSDLSTKALIDDPAEVIGCARSVNATANLIGVEISGTDTKLYLYDQNTNTFGALLETMTTSASKDPNFNPDSTWFVNGPANAWLVGLNGSTGNWELWERDLPFAMLTTELRHLGLATDQAQLYLTANDAGTLKCFAYNLDTLTLVNTASLGAATFVEVNDRDRGIFPAVKPGTDEVVFLRGRDGSNVAVQRSDDGGATFGDVDDVGWATTKYVVALLIDPLHPDDLVAVFDDDDLYQSLDGGETWAKLADAPGTLRAAGRHLIDAGRLMLAAQAVDTIHFTPNLGLTTEDVSDAALNTINAIEVSR